MPELFEAAVTIDARGKSGPPEAATHNPASVRSNQETSTPELTLAPERDDPLNDGFDTHTCGVE